MEKQAINTDFPSGLRKLILYHNKKTGKPVLWSKPVDSTYLDIWGAEEIAGGGYYWIAHKDWSGYSFSPGELLKLERLEAEARGKPSTFYVARLARERLERKLRARQENESWWADIMWREPGGG